MTLRGCTYFFSTCAAGAPYSFIIPRERNDSALFSLLTVAYAVCAFFEIYEPAMMMALVLAVIVEMIRISRFSLFYRRTLSRDMFLLVIVEMIRISRFSLFPADFFRPTVRFLKNFIRPRYFVFLSHFPVNMTKSCGVEKNPIFSRMRSFPCRKKSSFPSVFILYVFKLS